MEHSGARWISGQVMGEDCLMILRAVIGRDGGRGPPQRVPRLSKFFFFLFSLALSYLFFLFMTSPQQDRRRD